MDRRLFLKTVLSSSLALPLAGGLRTDPSGKGSALYLIADSPQDVLPGLLADIWHSRSGPGHRVALDEAHPLAEMVKQALVRRGWMAVRPGAPADIRLSFTSLGQACAPSFTLIENGRVVDIRHRQLMALWRDLARSASQSSVLTIAARETVRSSAARGRRAAIYLDGQQRDVVDLAQEFSKTYESAGGFVRVSATGGRVRVADSSCRQKICQSTSPVADAGERIICAPNRFYLEVEGRGRVDTIIG